MIEFPKFAKIKDHYCVCYFGQSDEYLVQLKLLKPVLEMKFPGIRLFIGCRDDRAHLLDGLEDVMRLSEIKARRFDFAHVKELRFNGQTHPVEDFLAESGVTDASVQATLQAEPTARCVVVTQGNYPTMPLEKRKVEEIKRFVKAEGFEPELDADITGAGLVVGVESVPLFRAASQGIRTRLCPTGVGTRLYKSLFPFGEVLHN